MKANIPVRSGLFAKQFENATRSAQVSILIIGTIRAMRLQKKLQGREWLLALVVMFVGLLVTLVSTFFAYNKKGERNLDDFLQASRLLEREVVHRLEANLHALPDTRGLLIAKKGAVSQQDLQRFQSQHNLSVEYPGLVATGFVRRVPARRLDNYLAQRKSDPSFLLKSPKNHPGDSYIVEIAEPYSLSKHIIGLDLCAHPELTGW